MLKKITILFLFIFSFSLSAEVVVGAGNSTAYMSLIQGNNVALVVNQSSEVYGEHLVDKLLREKIKVKKIFAPEHGFRGTADAGQHIKSGFDSKTGLPIVSLYGTHKKPTKQDLQNIDSIVFDIQDVGVRFYTYLSTLHYILESAAESNISVIVLDRPNPNGGRIDGEVLNLKYTSFVGMHPVPILYGMTIGEYALMINGEGWLKGEIKADLKVIRLGNYTHRTPYSLTIKPSPNLPNDLSIYLYPSLAFFEGTTFSAGRGTTQQFQLYGSPYYTNKTFSFKPISREGAKFPKHQNKTCYGIDLRVEQITVDEGINLTYILDAYANYPYKKKFFLKNKFIDNLSGSSSLRLQIAQGKSAKQIKERWQKGLEQFKTVRQQYLLYP
ncbi:DUF1343 domain-containing protein [bacterium]|nr:DUF1343 domain-containing protein [bacterium]MBU1958322.1 DUF1343 domain-containing protein [bacterium]